MFAKKKDYEKLAQDVKTHHFALFGHDWGTSGIVTRLNNKIDQTCFEQTESRLNSRIEELENLLIKAGILVEVQEPEADFASIKPEFNRHNQRIGSKQVRYAVKKIK